MCTVFVASFLANVRIDETDKWLASAVWAVVDNLVLIPLLLTLLYSLVVPKLMQFPSVAKACHAKIVACEIETDNNGIQDESDEEPSESSGSSTLVLDGPTPPSKGGILIFSLHPVVPTGR